MLGEMGSWWWLMYEGGERSSYGLKASIDNRWPFASALRTAVWYVTTEKPNRKEERSEHAHEMRRLNGMYSTSNSL
jgi:hypothetical protein